MTKVRYAKRTLAIDQHSPQRVLGAEAVKANQPLGTTQFGPVLAFVIGWQHYFLLKDIKPDDTGADCLPGPFPFWWTRGDERRVPPR